MWHLFAAVALFLIGLRLCAFFSGNETGFYRVNFLRVSIDAQAGDRIARRLQWFSHNPGYFVATTLVGTNIANYLITVAVNWGVVSLFDRHTTWFEVAGTLLVSPVVFVGGELVPKNLYYRVPLRLLRSGSLWFEISFWAFLPFSFPLILMTKLFERFAPMTDRPVELVLGRTRLAEVLGRGRTEGILTEVQNRLVHGLLSTAARPVAESMIPNNRVLGLRDDATREQILDFARRYGLSSVPLSRSNEDSWIGYVRIADLAISPRPLRTLIRPMPAIRSTLSKLEALTVLRSSAALYGTAVDPNGRVLGVVSEHGLTEQLFRPTKAVGASLPGPIEAE